jgi:hypothetical protein
VLFAEGRALLDNPFRPRTACDLEVEKIDVKRPEKFDLPALKDIETSLPKLISAVSGKFARPATTVVVFE